MIRIVATLALTLVAFSCTTATIRLDPNDLPAAASPWTTTGILLSYEVPEKNCELQIKNLADATEYSIPLQEGRHTVLISAPKGGYQGERLVCPRFRKWELQRFLRKEVELTPSKINYIGHAKFDLDDTGKELTVLFGDRKRDTDGLALGFKTLPAPWRKAVVSAATGKPLRETMTSTSNEWDERLKIKTKRFAATAEDKVGATDGEPMKGLNSGLAACDQEEQSRYSLRLGRLHYLATYVEGKLQNLEKKTNDHAFSDELEHCFEDIFQKFSPSSADKFEVTIEL